jgi:AhpD family alkylhydroperoxidase
MDKETLLKQVAALLEDDSLTEAITEMYKNERGGLGFLLNILKRRPRTFNPYVFKGMSLLGQPTTLDVKTAELIAIGAAAALMCEHCLEAHINQAAAEGATFEEILDAILIAGAIAESSTLAVALRKFKQMEAKHNPITKKED